MPGNVISMPNTGLPVTMLCTSTPTVDLPIILKSLGSFKVTDATSGTGIAATFEASSPYPIDLPDFACNTLPEAVVNSLSGTFQVCAAASTNIRRPVAPTRRIGIQPLGVPVLPPVDCPPYFESRSACSTFTSFQSTSSSSAIIIGSVFLMPEPVSGFFPLIVTLPSAATLMNTSGAGGGACGPPRPPRPPCCCCAFEYSPKITPPPASADTRRKLRRPRLMSFIALLLPSRIVRGRHRLLLPRQSRRAMHRLADPQIRSAAAQVAVHGGIDIRICGLRFLGQQRSGGHDLPGLAVAALWNVHFLPCLLHGMRAVGGETFLGCDGRFSRRRDRREASPHRLST